MTRIATAVIALLALSFLGSLPGRAAVLPQALVGAWDCNGHMGAGARVHRSFYRGELILNDRWLQLSEEDREPATGYKAVYLIGANPSGGLISYDANTFGTATYTSASDWSANDLILVSPPNTNAQARYVQDRFVFTVAPGQFSVDWQVRKDTQADWKTADHLICTPQAQH